MKTVASVVWTVFGVLHLVQGDWAGGVAGLALAGVFLCLIEIDQLKEKVGH